MKKTSLLLFLICILSTNVKATDSTSLYLQRVKKIKEFASWLQKEAKTETVTEGIYYQYDSASNKNWEIFNKAKALFFNVKIVDSLIQDTINRENIFAPEFKARMFIGLISRFSDLSHRIAIDSLKLKADKWNQPYNPSVEDEMNVKNTIIQYFIIDGVPINYLFFSFEENKTKLLFINVSEPPGEEGEKLRNYYQSLRIK